MNKLMVRMLAGLIACVGATNAHAQAVDTFFQVNFATDLASIPTLITLSYDGANGIANPICANAYAFSANGPMLACCSCRLGPNNVRQVSVRNDLLLSANKTPPDSVVIKLMGSSTGNAACNAATVGLAGNSLTTGMVAWSRRGSVAFNNGVPFTPATLSAGELSTILTQCSALEAAGRTCCSCP